MKLNVFKRTGNKKKYHFANSPEDLYFGEEAKTEFMCEVCCANIPIDKSAVYHVMVGMQKMDAIDCKKCGCQKLMAKRYPQVISKEEYEREKEISK